MKKELFFSVFLIAACIFLNNCIKTPVYPDTPEITFNNIEKYPAGDSVAITINFKDGDGDLGLDPDFFSPPFNEYNYIKDGSGNYIKLGSSSTLPPYSCTKYNIGYFFSTTVRDTVLADYNPNYHNYHIEILIKQSDGSYLKFDDSDLCYFNQRFPKLSTKEGKGPIEGTLTHMMKSGLFFKFFGGTLKFKIYILDRALNKSNVIETPDVVMN
jgi:hypothetical protein